MFGTVEVSAWECAEVVVFWEEGMVVSESTHVDIVILPPRASKINFSNFLYEIRAPSPESVAACTSTVKQPCKGEGPRQLPPWKPWYSEE